MAGDRPRIKTVVGATIEVDELAFVNNKCSGNARKISSVTESIEFEIWFDKHYHNREQHGDKDGKRIGIENEFVSMLINNSAKHLLYYSLRVQSFNFINFEPIALTDRGKRIVLTQKYDDSEDLNIIAEYHFVGIKKYEVTVRTAMSKNKFSFSDGQFKIEIESDGNNSTLYKNERGIIKTISEFNT